MRSRRTGGRTGGWGVVLVTGDAAAALRAESRFDASGRDDSASAIGVVGASRTLLSSSSRSFFGAATASCFCVCFGVVKVLMLIAIPRRGVHVRTLGLLKRSATKKQMRSRLKSFTITNAKN